jgi:hypothetical protein
VTVRVGRYLGVAAAVAAVAALVGLGLEGPVRRAVWAGAGLAFGLQAVCFSALAWAARRGPAGFLAGWAAGIALRLVAVGVVAWVRVDAWGLARGPALAALGSVLFALVLLEAVALKPLRGAGVARA